MNAPTELAVALAFLVAAAQPAGAQAAAGQQDACMGTRLPIHTGVGGSAPYVDLTLEGRRGPFLIDYGAGASSVEHGIWPFTADDARWQGHPTEPGSTITLSTFDLPGWAGQPIRFRSYDRNVSRPGLGLQHGVVGIDLIANQNVSFHYNAKSGRHLVIGKFNEACGSSDLREKGFRRIDQTGHWDGTAPNAPDGVFNGPVVHLELARADEPAIRLGLVAWAQLDTGYEDDVRPFSIDVNQAYMTKLAALGTSLVEGPPVTVTGCTGRSHARRTYTVPGHVLRVEDGAGAEVVRLPRFSFIQKNADEGCGGIADSGQPAGQLGASFLTAFGITLFMGSTKEVWIRPPAPAR